MLSQTGEEQARGMDFIDITSLRMGILEMWAGVFLIFFTSFYII